MPPARINGISVEQPHDRTRRARGKAGITERHGRERVHGHAVNILDRGNSLEGRPLVDLRRDRMLEQNSVHLRVSRQPGNDTHQLRRRKPCGQADMTRADTRLAAPILLHPHVRHRRRIITRTHRGQTGPDASRGLQPGRSPWPVSGCPQDSTRPPPNTRTHGKHQHRTFAGIPSHRYVLKRSSHRRARGATARAPAPPAQAPGATARWASQGRRAAQTVLVVRTVRSSRRRTLSGPSLSMRVSSAARSSSLIRPSRLGRMRRRDAWA